MVAVSLNSEESCGRWYKRRQQRRRFEGRTLLRDTVVGFDLVAVQLIPPRVLFRWGKTLTAV